MFEIMKGTFEEVISSIALSSFGVFHHVVSKFIHMPRRPENGSMFEDVFAN